MTTQILAIETDVSCFTWNRPIFYELSIALLKKCNLLELASKVINSLFTKDSTAPPQNIGDSNAVTVEIKRS